MDQPEDRQQMSDKARRRKARKSAKETKRVSKPLEAKNESQQFYLECLRTCDQVFAVGGAGTGKTYIAARWAIKQLNAGHIDKIYIARPTVAKAKHSLGFLPGSMAAKLRPWLIPLMDAMKDEVSGGVLDKLLQSHRIEFLSFEHLRGRSLPNCIVILDEAQNCDVHDLQLFLTRIGEGTQIIVSGDTDQVDIPNSGLETVLDMIDEYDLDAAICEFTEEDVVRSETAKMWVTAFKRKQND